MKKHFFSLFSITLILLITGCQSEKAHPLEPGILNGDQALAKSGQMRIMTRNVYVGTDVDQIMVAAPEDIPFIAADLFQLLNATNFSERADALAREIRRAKPHLIGLQEISTIRIQMEGDYLLNGQVDAEDVLYDYLDLLLQALANQNLNYRPAAVVQNFDVEIPMFTGMQGDMPLFADIRLTDYDVILVDDEVSYSNVFTKNYDYGIDLPHLNLHIPRGYAAIDAELNDRIYRFVNTHLEDPAGNPDLVQLQLAQTAELISYLEEVEYPVIVVGDFNSPASSGPTYELMLSSGYHDLWKYNRKVSEGAGYTYGHAADLRNPVAEFTERIDFVFWKDGDKDLKAPVIASVTGDSPTERTVSGLWPSDHGGVVVKFPLTGPGN